MSEKGKKELNAEELNQVTGGDIETKWDFWGAKRVYRFSEDGVHGEWGTLEDANKQNNEYHQKKYGKGNITINQN